MSNVYCLTLSTIKREHSIFCWLWIPHTSFLVRNKTIRNSLKNHTALLLGHRSTVTFNKTPSGSLSMLFFTQQSITNIEMSQSLNQSKHPECLYIFLPLYKPIVNINTALLIIVRHSKMFHIAYLAST